MPGTLTERQQALDGWVAYAARGAKLLPRAVVGVLVRPEADQLRAVPEAVPLDLVVAHLGNELRAQRRLLELARAPAVRLREAAVGGLVEERQDERLDLVVTPRSDRRGADI